MKDLVEKAIDGQQDETERVATGKVKGYDIEVKKESYQQVQRGPSAWRVAVHVGDEGPVADEQKKDLEANKAQELFEELVEKYALVVK